MSCMQAAVELSPTDAGLYVRLGRALSEPENSGRQTAAFRAALAIEPANVAAANHLGGHCIVC